MDCPFGGGTFEGTAMTIDPAPQAFREEFDSWHGRPHTWDRDYAVTTRYYYTDDPPLYTPLPNVEAVRSTTVRILVLNRAYTGHSVRLLR